MASRLYAAALSLNVLCLAQTTTTASATATPTCGLVGYDEGSAIAYYADSAVTQYSSYSACNAQCDSNTACLSFAIDPSVACILYTVAAESNVVLSSTSPFAFFDRGGTCPIVTTTSASTEPVATPTCTGLVGYDAGGTNIGFYADAASATYSGCLALCNANEACLSFSITSQPACILYNYTVEGYDVASPGSGNTFYDRGGACPSTTVSSITTSTTATVIATPTCTGLVGYDAGGTNIGFYADVASATYSGCLGLCSANPECLSFGIVSGPACVLYNYMVEGNDVSSPGSGNTFYDAGGACPSTTVTAPTSTITTPVQTGAFANVSYQPEKSARSAQPPPPPAITRS